jgi:hypothetical protein
MSNQITCDPDTDPATFGELEHVTVVEDDNAARCTVFPQQCDDEQLVTHWLTAEASSFVPLDQMV